MATKSIALQIDTETRGRVDRLADRQDAVNAWAEHQENGLHVNAKEVTAWLETWDDDPELPAPKCNK